MEDKAILAQSNSAEAQNAVAVAEEARQKAQSSQMSVTIEQALENFFQRSVAEGRFIPLTKNRMADTERFKFICDEIAETHIKVEEIKADSQKQKADIQDIKRDNQWQKWLLMGIAGGIGLIALKALGGYPL